MSSRPCRRPEGRLALIALLFLSAPAAAAPPPLLPEETVAALAAELSGTEALRTVGELTLHHRMRGSEGYRAAAEAIRERAEAYGLSDVEILELPADGEIFYGTQRSRPAWDAELAELWEVDARGGERRLASYDLRPVTLAQDSVSGRATADLVDVGAGTSEADYEGLDVAGKLVLTSSQPGAVAELAVGRHGAAGIVSWAQNQRSAWWSDDETLVRWGHLGSFDDDPDAPPTFAFMVSPAQAAAWRERLAAGEAVRLRAEVRAGRHPGVYAIPTATIPGADPELRRQEIVFSCHLDHQRPGANDNASGCATILEVARALAKLVREGKIPPPRRTLRFVWPPEIEGTIALLNAHPHGIDWASRARAVIHLDMVGGDPETTKAVFHVTRSPASLPTVANDVAEAFARWVNEETYRYAATGAAAFPLAEPGGGREPLQARIAPFSMGSDHQVWAEGSFRVPAIYMNDWPDRYIHTHADGPQNLDPTKLLRASFLAAASGYALASLDGDDVPALLDAVRRHALERTADAMARAAELPPEEGSALLWRRLQDERAIVASVARFAPPPAEAMEEAAGWLDRLEALARAAPPAWLESARSGELDPSRPELRRCARREDPKGPLWGFGYSYFADRLAAEGLESPGLLSHQGPWGGGGEYAYELLNRIDGRHLLGEIRDALAATYGPVSLELVDEYVDVLERIGVVECDPALLDFAGAPTAPLAERAPGFPPPEDPRELALAGFAKVVCSAVWVSGREASEAAENSAIIMVPGGDASWIDWTVDEEAREVRATGEVGEVAMTRVARFHGDQGCTTLPAGSDGILFQPVPVNADLPAADEQGWPMGDRDALAEDRFAAAEEAAFADPSAMTAAFVVVHDGRIVAERYAEERGIGPDTQLESWSMGKSLTATLVGRLIHEGAFGLHDPAPVPAWRGTGDPRGAITVVDLLRMSSGLRCVAPRDPDYSVLRGYPEHMYIYTGAVDLFDFATRRPLQFPPGTEGRYRNCDPLTLGYLVRREAERRGEEYLTFPQRLLFDRIGIRRQVLETDPWGNFSLTGYDYGTARNWARLGLLYLRDGVWPGEDGPERLLPEGFTDLVSAPAPAWKEPVYGGLFWLNLDGTFDLPRDAYYMAGAGGQYVIVVPSLDLVVVRMGHLRGGPRAVPSLNAALPGITQALVAGPIDGAQN